MGVMIRTIARSGPVSGPESVSQRAIHRIFKEGLLVVTDRTQARGPLLDVVKEVLEAGARVVLLREKDLPREQRLELAHQLRELGAYVIAAGPDPLGGDAMHLSAADRLDATRAVAAERAVGLAVIGRSCHSAEEAAALSDEDYCTLSPIFETLSKPGYGPALGLQFPAGKPIYALGGIDSADKARACRDAGAAGVAVMGAIMRNPALTKEFLR